MLIQKRKPVPCFDFPQHQCAVPSHDSTPHTVILAAVVFLSFFHPPFSSFNSFIRQNVSFYRAASRGAQMRLVDIMCLDLWRRLPPRPQVMQEMTMSKMETMPLMMAVSMAPMPLTMAIRQLPMVRKMASN
jgi:hypothetical protein